MVKKTKKSNKTLGIVRDVVFILVIVYAAVMTYLMFSAEADAATAEIEYITHNAIHPIAANQSLVAMN